MNQESRAKADRRWTKEGVRDEVATARDEYRRQFKAENPKATREETRDYAWNRVLNEFQEDAGYVTVEAEPAPEPLPKAESPAREPDGVTGLSNLPPDWPALPANASLQSEILWVQSNRLSMVSGTGDTAHVKLGKASSPPPSMAAIGWLETSIRAYSKYCDIAARATATQEHEAEHVRRERRSIDEVRGLLAEMLPDGPTCPACGKVIGN